jgi:hypothetical protein
LATQSFFYLRIRDFASIAFKTKSKKGIGRGERI